MTMRLTTIIAALLLWSSLGGCPTTIPAGDDGDSQNPGLNDDQNNDGDAANDGGQDDGSSVNDSNDGSQDDGGSSTDDGSSNDGSSADDGSSDSSSSNDGGQDDGQTSDDGAAISGTFSGTLNCHKTESAQGSPGPEDDWTTQLDFTLNANVPTQFIVPAYRQPDHGNMTFAVSAVTAGDSVSVTMTDGSYTATLTATVREATYTATTGHVILDLEYHGAEGALTEDGTGTFTLDYTISGDTITYTAVTDYDVTMVFVSTEWTLTCTGTLTSQ